MPIDIEGEPLWHDTIVGPANDDDADEDTFCDGLALLQDNAKWLDARFSFVSNVTEVVIGDISDTLDHDYTPAVPLEVTVETYAPSADIQLACQMQPIQLAGVYVLQLLLHDGSVIAYEGPECTLDGSSAGAVSPVIAHFTGVDAGTYTVRLRVRDVSGSGHTMKAYAMTTQGVRMGGHAT